MTVVNLNKARKNKARVVAKAQAAENRIRSGRTKVEKAFDDARAKANRIEGQTQRLSSDEGAD